MGEINVLFVLGSLGGGGAERVAVNVVKALHGRGFTFSFALMKQEGDYFSEVPAGVRIYDLEKNNGTILPAAIRRIANLSGLIRGIKPDIVFSFLWSSNIRIMLAKFLSRSKARFVVSEHIYIQKDTLRWRDRLGVIITYRFADGIVTASEGAKEGLAKYTGLPPARITTIYYPIDVDGIRKRAEEPLPGEFRGLERPWVVSMGRLTYQKNYPLLLEAFARQRKILKKGTLIIIGRGDAKTELEDLSGKLGVENCVYWAGFQKNPHSIIRNSDLFVLSSHFEGFPNVVLEAMANSVPVIATDCPSGPSEMIDNYKSGILVPVDDAEKMSKAMGEVLGSGELRRSLSIGGYNRARDFSFDRIIPQYKDFMESIAGKKRDTETT